MCKLLVGLVVPIPTYPDDVFTYKSFVPTIKFESICNELDILQSPITSNYLLDL